MITNRNYNHETLTFFCSLPYTVTVPGGVTNVTFDIAINNDDVYEGNENFMLTINLSTLPTGVTVGNPDQATVTIVDDDRKYFHYHLNYVLCYTVQHKFLTGGNIDELHRSILCAICKNFTIQSFFQ